MRGARTTGASTRAGAGQGAIDRARVAVASSTSSGFTSDTACGQVGGGRIELDGVHRRAQNNAHVCSASSNALIPLTMAL